MASHLRQRLGTCARTRAVRYRHRVRRADGTWRSLVAHLTGGQGVAGSNPAVPTGFSNACTPNWERKSPNWERSCPAVPQAHTGIPRRQAEQPWPSNPPRRAAAWPGPAGSVAQAGRGGLQNGPLQPTPGTASRWRSPAPAAATANDARLEPDGSPTPRPDNGARTHALRTARRHAGTQDQAPAAGQP